MQENEFANMTAAEIAAHLARYMPPRLVDLPPGVMPRYCMARLVTDDSPILVTLGESGYRPAAHLLAPGETPENWNRARGITAAHSEAMVIGSCFGWGVPGADPMQYQEGPVNYVCRECGSDAVTSDARAQWSVTDQAWQLVDTDADGYCQECDGPAKLETRPVQAPAFDPDHVAKGLPPIPARA